MFLSLFSIDLDLNNTYKLWDLLQIEPAGTFHMYAIPTTPRKLIIINTRFALAACITFESRVRSHINSMASELKKVGIPKSLESKCIAAGGIRSVIPPSDINRSFSKIFSLATSSSLKSFWSNPIKSKSVPDIQQQIKEYQLNEESRRFELLHSLRELIVINGLSLHKNSVKVLMDQIQESVGTVNFYP